jgi:nematocidal protein AidA
MAIIDVLIVVDVQRIMHDCEPNDAGRTGTYVPLGNRGEGQGYVYMVTTWYHAQGEATSELDVFAQANDTIRWRMTSISQDNNYSCFMTGFVFTSPNPTTYVTPPKPMFDTIKALQIDKSVASLNAVIPVSKDDFYWESTVLKPGPVTYHTKFLVFCQNQGGGGGGNNDPTGGGGNNDPTGGGGNGKPTGGGGGGGNPYGGYQWDPFINTRL